jgi:hypothetical protein
MKFKTLTTIVALALMPLAGLVALTLALSMGTASVSASSERNRHLHAVKECSNYTGEAGSFCTITSSNLAEIKIGSNVFYDQAAGVPAGLLDSNVVLDAGHGNRAVGRCTLDLTTNLGLCTFSETGQFTGFHARVRAMHVRNTTMPLDGTYSFARIESIAKGRRSASSRATSLSRTMVAFFLRLSFSVISGVRDFVICVEVSTGERA